MLLMLILHVMPMRMLMPILIHALLLMLLNATLTSIQHHFNIISTSFQHQFNIISTSIQHQFNINSSISYDTWETLAMKAVWMRDDWLKGTSRMPGNGRYGGGIIWSIDTDDFNNAMPHHWVIACYLESNYYLSKTPMCQCRFWKTWAKNNLPGAPANIDDQFKICNRTACNADDPLGLLDDGVRRRRTSDAAGAPRSGSSTYIHHDSHSRIEHNRAASEEIQKRRVRKHEREVHHHRQHHLRRRMDYHQKHGTHTTRQHGRRLVPDRRHLTADSVTAPVHECTTSFFDLYMHCCLCCVCSSFLFLVSFPLNPPHCLFSSFDVQSRCSISMFNLDAQSRCSIFHQSFYQVPRNWTTSLCSNHRRSRTIVPRTSLCRTLARRKTATQCYGRRKKSTTKPRGN